MDPVQRDIERINEFIAFIEAACNRPFIERLYIDLTFTDVVSEEKFLEGLSFFFDMNEDATEIDIIVANKIKKILMDMRDIHHRNPLALEHTRAIFKSRIVHH